MQYQGGQRRIKDVCKDLEKAGSTSRIAWKEGQLAAVSKQEEDQDREVEDGSLWPLVKKAFSLPADVSCALTYMLVTSEEEQTPSGEASGPSDTDLRVGIQRKEWMIMATDFCRRQKH